MKRDALAISEVELDLSVVIPLYDKRVSEEACLESWCRNQTLPRERYEVIVTSNGADPDADRRVEKFLTGPDRLVSSPGVNMAALYDLGCREARAPIIFVTELHCIAEDDCLEQVHSYLAENEDLAGACVKTYGGCPNTFAKVEETLFDGYFKGWSSPESWMKVLLRGFAIRKNVYLDAGGFDPRYNRFADTLLGAKLHKAGYRLGYAEKARLEHFYSTSYRQFYTPVAETTADNCRYRLVNPEDFADEYFGTHPDWSERQSSNPRNIRKALRHYLGSLFRSLRHPGNSPEWTEEANAELLRMAQASLFGQLPRRISGQFRVWHEALRCWLHRNDLEELIQVYPCAYNRIETLERLRYIARFVHPTQIQVAMRKSYSAADLSDDQLVGFGRLETWNEEGFRWSSAAGIIFLSLPRNRYRLRVPTNALRGHPRAYILDVYFNDRRLKVDFIDQALVCEVPPESFEEGETQTLTFTSIPVKQSEMDPSDDRCLGVPVFGVYFQEIA